MSTCLRRLEQLPPNPKRVTEDRRRMLHDAAAELLSLAVWHGQMGIAYHDVASDYGATYHAIEMRRCMVVYLKTMKDIAALSTEGVSHAEAAE